MTRIIHFSLQFAVIGLAVAFVLVWFRPDLLPALDEQPAASPDSYADAINRTAPAVVSIYTRTLVSEPLGLEFSDPLFNALYRDRMITRPRRGLGSGVIVSADGLILTTRHVIAEVDDILVALYDGRVAEAVVVGSDPATDLALLRVDMRDLPVATLAADYQPRAGDVVLAIGNAFGLSHTVTMGIISATGRGQLNLSSYEDLIQTDAAINAGNSGGALISPRGEVVGINSASLGQNTGAQGISFAIPADLARQVMDQIAEHGRVQRAWLGAEFADMGLSMSDSGEVRTGARISRIDAGGPAREAGLQRGDVVVRLEGREIDNTRSLMRELASFDPGDRVNLHLLRGDRLLSANVALARQPAPGG